MSANYSDLLKAGVKPWSATIALDISGYDIVKKITGPEPSDFYIDKFGSDLDYVKKASPFHVVDSKIPPFFAVCNIASKDACSQSDAFVQKAKGFGTHAQILEVDLPHMEINWQLGKNPEYTAQVDGFLRTLSPTIQSLLSAE